MEAEQLKLLKSGQVKLPPLKLRVLRGEAILRPSRWRVDAVLEAGWRKRRYRFAVECKSRSTPKVIQEAIGQIRAFSQSLDVYPMILVPYLSDEQLGQLEAQEISGLDLCGNGIVIVPGELLVVRMGAPNRFPASLPIKNVYRGDTALVARAFLLRPEYPNVKEIWEELRRRGGTLALSTISKALKGLEEDLVVGRAAKRLRLLQPDKLLDKLVENYNPPKIARRFIGKSSLQSDVLAQRISRIVQARGLRCVLTGAGAARRYAVMAREEKLSVYCSDQAALLTELGKDAREETLFPNLEILETSDAFVYFDARGENGYAYASPVQTYLELMAGDKRDRETAQQLYERLLVSPIKIAQG